MVRVGNIIIRALRSELFFRLTLVWFGLQATWLAFTALYPMAFDEAFHFDVMHIYSDRFLPFWSSTPDGSWAYGALTRDPSYMYHFLMSFPLRMLEPILKTEASQVIFLRLTSVTLFIIGLWLFRKVLLRAKVSKALSNLVIFMLAATPMVSLLAAQINYDNAIFALLPATLLYFQKTLQHLKTNKKLDVQALLVWALLCMFASLIKYAFLPAALAMGLILIVSYFRHSTGNLHSRKKALTHGFAQISPPFKAVLVTSFIILFGLCFERYGINVIRYKTPTPECNQVLTVQQCLEFGPWRRNYYTRLSKLSGKLNPDTNPARYAIHTWLSQTTYQLFYTLDGPRAGYKVGWAFRVNRVSSVVVFVLGVGLFLVQWKYIARRYDLTPLLAVSGIYFSALIAQNYADFVHLGYPFGIQGRYLIPMLPIVYASVGVAFVSGLRRWKIIAPYLAATAMIVIVTQGGGISTYILRSEPAWYWPNQTVVRFNDTARKILRPFVIGN